MTVKSNFAKNFKYFREKARLGQEALAEKIGVNVRTISIYENGKGYPKVDLLMKISQALEVPTEHFFADDPESVAKNGSTTTTNSTIKGDDLSTSGKIIAYRKLLNQCHDAVESGDKQLVLDTLQAFSSALQDLENIHRQNTEIDAKLKYATQLISSLAGGKP